ncbi:MAG: glucose-6-phosphate dehydrogenase assembly protein OpcA [Chloroflexi bacterium]|nr:glucose-6-phosphate dehydrogenase assembly protein OpcA [Chloroflexota bacterium]
MHHGASLRLVGEWSGHGVDARQIPAELTRLWRETSEQALATGQPAAARTNVLTLLVIGRDLNNILAAAHTVGAMTEFHPSRSLFVHWQLDHHTSSLDVEVSASCRIDRPEVCHESVTLHARAFNSKQLVSTLNLLLLRDLPTYLWWLPPLQLEDESLGDFVALCDGLLVDAATHRDSIGNLVALHHFVDLVRFGISDLAWTRIRGWREVIAGLCDERDVRSVIGSCTQVTIGWKRDVDELPAEALYLLGWLGTALQWRTEQPLHRLRSSGSVECHAAARAIQVSLEASDTEADIVVTHVTFATDADRSRVDMHLGLSNQVSIRVVHNGQTARELTVSLRSVSDPEALSSQLRQPGRDDTYHRTLEWLAPWH